MYEQVCEAMNQDDPYSALLERYVHSTAYRLKRFAGMVEASLMEEGLTTEIIADGYHLPSSLMRMAYRLKDQTSWPWSAMRCAPPAFGYTVAERNVFVDEGVA